MKLVIKRDQADVKGLFGGHKGVSFSLYTRAEITSEERELIERYNVGSYTMASYEDTVGLFEKQPVEVTYSVSDLVNGKTTEMSSIVALMDLEESIKGACRNLKILLSVMSTFGGEEVTEI